MGAFKQPGDGRPRPWRVAGPGAAFPKTILVVSAAIILTACGGDGGLRRLGPASRSAAFSFGLGVLLLDDGFNFALTGRELAYVDLGPDGAGEESAQVFVPGLTARDATQVTALAAVGLSTPSTTSPNLSPSRSR